MQIYPTKNSWSYKMISWGYSPFNKLIPMAPSPNVCLYFWQAALLPLIWTIVLCFLMGVVTHQLYLPLMLLGGEELSTSYSSSILLPFEYTGVTLYPVLFGCLFGIWISVVLGVLAAIAIAYWVIKYILKAVFMMAWGTPEGTISVPRIKLPSLCKRIDFEG